MGFSKICEEYGASCIQKDIKYAGLILTLSDEG